MYNEVEVMIVKLGEIARMISKIHENLYEIKALKFENIEQNVIKITFQDLDYIVVDNIIDPKRYRFVFTDYVGKIDDYRDYFDSILGNNVDLCDTGDFLNLSNTETTKVFESVFGQI